MRRTRQSVLKSQENIIEAPKKSRGKLRKRTNSDESEESSPNKSSRSESLSPTITKLLHEQLTVTTPKSTSKSKYGSAKRALADNSNFRLPGRELQFEELTKFLNELIKSNRSASIYVNGTPGKICTFIFCKITNDFFM